MAGRRTLNSVGVQSDLIDLVCSKQQYSIAVPAPWRDATVSSPPPQRLPRNSNGLRYLRCGVVIDAVDSHVPLRNVE